MLSKDELDAPWDAARTVDPGEIARFTALAQEWWKPDGKFRTVHDFNAARLGYILERIGTQFHHEEDDLSGLRILDIGCGAGLLCEPLADRGAKVHGIDATARNVEIARHHAAERDLDIDYRHCLAEHLLEAEAPFDVVLNTEVVEHVADPSQLMAECGALVKPGGMLIVATINRTLRAFLIAIVGAEYLLRWLPKGTHDWQRFLRPREIAAMLAPQSLVETDRTGVAFSPFARRWRLTRDTSVNYMLTAKKRAA
tara:strand:- start:7212 stop:7976 length:765 start_codon:yes stop_codon:yes gene_type:complete